MSILNNFYRNYLSWRPNYYYLKMMETVGIDPGKMKKYFIMLKYLKNYKQCYNSTQKNYYFRNRNILKFIDKSDAENIFWEIFLNNCYALKLTHKKRVVLDIGANVGFFTFYSLLKSPNAKIISIEADPKNFNVLYENIYENNLNTQVHLLNNAVFSKKGKVKFYSSNNNTGWSSIYNSRGAKHGECCNIETIKISDILSKYKLETVDVCKIDVEGAEYDIILNDRFLDKFKIKKLFIEVDQNPRDDRFAFDQLIEYLKIYYFDLKIKHPETEYPLIICQGYKNR